MISSTFGAPSGAQRGSGKSASESLKVVSILPSNGGSGGANTVRSILGDSLAMSYSYDCTEVCNQTLDGSSVSGRSPLGPIESECAAPLGGTGFAEASRVRWPISVSDLAGRPYCIPGIGFFPTAATP